MDARQPSGTGCLAAHLHKAGLGPRALATMLCATSRHKLNGHSGCVKTDLLACASMCAFLRERGEPSFFMYAVLAVGFRFESERVPDA